MEGTGRDETGVGHPGVVVDVKEGVSWTKVDGGERDSMVSRLLFVVEGLGSQSK